MNGSESSNMSVGSLSHALSPDIVERNKRDASGGKAGDRYLM